MRTLTQIALVLGLILGHQNAASAQGSFRGEIRQAETKLEQLDRSLAQATAVKRRLDTEIEKVNHRLETFGRLPSSSLEQSEQQRLARKRMALMQRRRMLSARVKSIREDALAEAASLLALYEQGIARGELRQRTAIVRRDSLRGRLGLKVATDRSPGTLLREAEQARLAEANLRRKARLVATRIRSLRRQSELASDVMRSVRDQALFDEEERRLTVSRVRTSVINEANTRADTREAEAPGAAIGDSSERTSGETGDPSAVPAEPSDGFADGDDDTSGYEGQGHWDGSAGNTSADIGGGAGAPAVAQSGLSLIHSVVSGSRLNTLLDKDVETLVDQDGAMDSLVGPEEELQRLQQLRKELLRGADELSQRRAQLEVEARTPNR